MSPENLFRVNQNRRIDCLIFTGIALSSVPTPTPVQKGGLFRGRLMSQTRRMHSSSRTAEGVSSTILVLAKGAFSDYRTELFALRIHVPILHTNRSSPVD